MCGGGGGSRPNSSICWTQMEEFGLVPIDLDLLISVILLNGRNHEAKTPQYK